MPLEVILSAWAIGFLMGNALYALGYEIAWRHRLVSGRKTTKKELQIGRKPK